MANIAVGNTITLSEYILTAAIHERAVQKRSNDDPKSLITMRAIVTCDQFAQQVKSDHSIHTDRTCTIGNPSKLCDRLVVHHVHRALESEGRETQQT